jgi:hypothetical protein
MNFTIIRLIACNLVFSVTLAFCQGKDIVTTTYPQRASALQLQLRFGITSTGPNGSFLTQASIKSNGASAVLMAAPAWASAAARDLYMSVVALPENISTIGILFYQTRDSNMFIGYYTCSADGKLLNFHAYPTPALKFETAKSAAWIKWIRSSLNSDKSSKQVR